MSTDNAEEPLTDCKRECDATVAQFLVIHPEYIDSPANAEHMRRYFTGRVSLERLEAAYFSLRDAALLELRGIASDQGIGDVNRNVGH